jgi:hypothetical protein
VTACTPSLSLTSLRHRTSGKTIYLSGLTPQSTIADIRSKVQDSEGIPPDQQTFRVAGHIGRLADEEADKTLAELNIPLRSVMTLWLRLRG